MAPLAMVQTGKVGSGKRLPPPGPLPHSPVCTQKFTIGNSRSGSSVSTLPSQSLSLPSHTSGPSGVQAYSQPLPTCPSRSTKPVLQNFTLHTPPVQPGTALGTAQAFVHEPHQRGSFCRSKPSSALPSQLLSWPSQISRPGSTGLLH